jgi:hypothetical protein
MSYGEPPTEETEGEIPSPVCPLPPIETDRTKAFAKITGEIGVIGSGGYQLQVRAEVTTASGQKVRIASLAVNMMTLDVGEQFLSEFRKTALESIQAQRAREKEQSERRIEVVREMPRRVKRTVW